MRNQFENLEQRSMTCYLIVVVAVVVEVVCHKLAVDKLAAHICCVDSLVEPSE